MRQLPACSPSRPQASPPGGRLSCCALGSWSPASARFCHQSSGPRLTAWCPQPTGIHRAGFWTPPHTPDSKCELCLHYLMNSASEPCDRHAVPSLLPGLLLCVPSRAPRRVTQAPICSACVLPRGREEVQAPLCHIRPPPSLPSVIYRGDTVICHILNMARSHQGCLCCHDWPLPPSRHIGDASSPAACQPAADAQPCSRAMYL